MRRAEIVCTLGPAINMTSRLVQLINAGINVVRLNISHGDYDRHKGRLSAIREATRIAGCTVGVLTGLQRPKIRLGRFVDDQEHYLERGDRFAITTEDVLDTKKRCSTTFKGLPGDVRPDDQVLIDDDEVGLRTLEVSPTKVLCGVVVVGPVSNNKGINLPGVTVFTPAVSEKDERDLHWVLSKDIDTITLSFVRSGDGIKRVREIVEEEGRRIPVIVRLEKPQAIVNFQRIVDAFDTFMVTRDNLRVELPLEDVPLVQKQIIHMTRRWARPIIVATQMLESMISFPQPTRAEVSDVANAILNDTDGMMLSGETSVGDYPVETVQAMAWIIEATGHGDHAEIHAIDQDSHTVGDVLAHATVEVTKRVGARYLVTFTKSGDTVRRLPRLRPSIPLLVPTPKMTIQQTMTLIWGVEVHITLDFTVQEQMVETVDASLQEWGMIEVDERIVILSGSPMRVPGKINNLRVRKVKAKGETDA